MIRLLPCCEKDSHPRMIRNHGDHMVEDHHNRLLHHHHHHKMVMAMVVGSAPATRSYRNAMVPPQRHERHCKPSRCSRRHVEQRILGGGGGGSGGGASSSSSLWLSLNGTQSSVYVVLNVLMCVCMCVSVGGCALWSVCFDTNVGNDVARKQTNERTNETRPNVHPKPKCILLFGVIIYTTVDMNMTGAFHR